MAEPVGLRHRRVMVAEDEYTIAEELTEVLSTLVGEVLGPVASVTEALRLAAEAGRIDGAVLDVNLQGQKVWPVVDVLRARGVPVVLTTGYDAVAIPAAYADLPRCEKPTSERDLVRALALVLPG